MITTDSRIRFDQTSEIIFFSLADRGPFIILFWMFFHEIKVSISFRKMTQLSTRIITVMVSFESILSRGENILIMMNYWFSFLRVDLSRIRSRIIYYTVVLLDILKIAVLNRLRGCLIVVDSTKQITFFQYRTQLFIRIEILLSYNIMIDKHISSLSFFVIYQNNSLFQIQWIQYKFSGGNQLRFLLLGVVFI